LAGRVAEMAILRSEELDLDSGSAASRRLLSPNLEPPTVLSGKPACELSATCLRH